ncbi:siderophore-interacting protein [Amnibacterium kyonggiense]|uniref:NADPH-dependent ferric siderophore reductase n=1 Tax=Amnibacterium kyonggiense TaxID=595671 RepID=A0A4R7FLN8_9MICO|nr:siderophore-interacting protein [Amnibacterium kyonggiense]TDS77342.1 NADPH-dependent ferric siderophore reductase [Amnibacterium kyonggiense]
MPTRTAAPDQQPVDAPFLLHRVRVAGRQRLSDCFVRITFTGPTLDRFADPGLDQRIKLILPAPDGSVDDALFSADWYGAWRALPNDRRPVIRTYTTRAVRQAAREVDVDLVVHEPCGPAGRFAVDCREGDEVVLLGPNRDAASAGGGIDFRRPATSDRVLIAGDETALPAIVRILQDLPDAVRGAAVVEVPRREDAAQLPAHPGVAVEVVERGDGPHGERLTAAVRRAAEALLTVRAGQDPEDVDVDGGLLWEVPGDGAIPAAEGPFYAWLAGEAGVIKGLRRMLVGELGVDRRSVAFMGYWRAGRAEGQ